MKLNYLGGPCVVHKDLFLNAKLYEWPEMDGQLPGEQHEISLKCCFDNLKDSNLTLFSMNFLKFIENGALVLPFKNIFAHNLFHLR